MRYLDNLRFKIHEGIADRIQGVQYPRMNQASSSPDFVEQWLNFSARFGVGILGIFLSLIALVIIVVGLFFLFWLGYFMIFG